MGADEPTEDDAGGAAVASVSATGRVYLIVRQGSRSQVVELRPGAEAVVGRDPAATVRVDEARVSRRHARIRWRGGELLLEDLGSRNGTGVGAHLLRGAERALYGGDLVTVGGCEIAVAVVNGGPPARPRPAARAAPDAGEAVSQGVVVADAGMRRLFALARRAARTTSTVLVVGETGSGKEIVARQIHAWSDRAARPFVRVNCAALPEPLVESELFGYERGAFTGADRRKVGLVEAASGGTLFLDEIGELALPIQAKLLGVLENRAVVRVGSTVETPVDLRVVCATHRDLPAEVAAGRFREDLYYRISPVIMKVPPLRERPAEIALLAELFARRLAGRGGPGPVLDDSAFAALRAHRWPGNVRELRNAIEHALVHTDDGAIRAVHLPETVRAATAAAASPPPRRDGVKAALAEVERACLEEALRETAGNRTRAAQRLGISLRALLYKIQKYGLR